jgi:hypothetical protein
MNGSSFPKCRSMTAFTHTSCAPGRTIILTFLREGTSQSPIPDFASPEVRTVSEEFTATLRIQSQCPDILDILLLAYVLSVSPIMDIAVVSACEERVVV